MPDVRLDVELDGHLVPVAAGEFEYLATPAPPPWAAGPQPDPIDDLELWAGSYNGWSFGWGTPWDITSVDGFADMMSLKTQDAALPGDGEVFGEDWEEKRVLTVEFGGGLALLERCWPRQPGLLPVQRLMEARCACLRRQDDLPLLLNERWLIMARPRRFVAPQRRGELPTVTVSWEAADPSLYAAEEQSASARLELRGEGRPYPRPSGAPGTIAGSWRYQGTSTGGLMLVHNRGCRRTFLRFRIWGPVTNPAVTNQRTGEKLELRLTLGPSDVLDVDMRRGTVTLNGTASRYWQLTQDSTWWACGPGTTPVRYFKRRAPLSNSRITTWWRSAW